MVFLQPLVSWHHTFIVWCISRLKASAEGEEEEEAEEDEEEDKEEENRRIASINLEDISSTSAVSSTSFPPSIKSAFYISLSFTKRWLPSGVTILEFAP